MRSVAGWCRIEPGPLREGTEPEPFENGRALPHDATGRSRRSPTTARSSTRFDLTALSAIRRMRRRGSSLSGAAGYGKSRASARCGSASFRCTDYVLIDNRRFQVSEDDGLVLTDVIEAHILGRELTFEVVRARRRQRLRVAPPGQEADGRSRSCGRLSHDLGWSKGWRMELRTTELNGRQRHSTA